MLIKSAAELLRDEHQSSITDERRAGPISRRVAGVVPAVSLRRVQQLRTVRASFYFYNTQAEVNQFVEVVKEIQKFFGN